MTTNSTTTIQALFGKWKNEDRELGRYLDAVRDWMHDVSQLGIPRFGETADRLEQLQDRLGIHFDREDEITEQLSDYYSSSSIELEAIRRQTRRDHQQLAERLEELIARLNELEPPFVSWESAIDEVELFVIVLEQHEDQHVESFETLIPRVPNQ